MPAIPEEMSRETVETEIRRQFKVEDFSIRTIKKMKDDGSMSHFGFLELRDAEDSRSLLRKKLVIDGNDINMRVSRPR